MPADAPETSYRQHNSMHDTDYDSLVTADALVQKHHQAISIHNTDPTILVPNQYHKKWLLPIRTHIRLKIHFEKKKMT